MAFAAAAVGTFALTVGVFWGREAVAVDSKATVGNVALPTLELGDIHVTARMSADKPRTILLSARNSSSQAVDAHFQAKAMVMSSPKGGSRSMPSAQVAWHEGYTAKLKPGESRQIAVTLPASAFGASGYLELATDDGKDSIRAVTLRN